LYSLFLLNFFGLVGLQFHCLPGEQRGCTRCGRPFREPSALQPTPKFPFPGCLFAFPPSCLTSSHLGDFYSRRLGSSSLPTDSGGESENPSSLFCSSSSCRDLFFFPPLFLAVIYPSSLFSCSGPCSCVFVSSLRFPPDFRASAYFPQVLRFVNGNWFCPGCIFTPFTHIHGSYPPPGIPFVSSQALLS